MYAVQRALLAAVEVDSCDFVTLEGDVSDVKSGVVVAVDSMVGCLAEHAVFDDATLARQKLASKKPRTLLWNKRTRSGFNNCEEALE